MLEVCGDQTWVWCNPHKVGRVRSFIRVLERHRQEGTCMTPGLDLLAGCWRGGWGQPRDAQDWCLPLRDPLVSEGAPDSGPGGPLAPWLVVGRRG